jgi:nucleotide-binding universal stress UspA family protein
VNTIVVGADASDASRDALACAVPPAVLVGAVSGQPLRAAHCPVIVVPRGAEGRLARAA